MREFLEKNHKDDMSREDTIKLTVKSLLEVVQTGAKNIEISVMESYGVVTVCSFHFQGILFLAQATPCRVLTLHRSRLSLQILSGRRRPVRRLSSHIVSTIPKI